MKPESREPIAISITATINIDRAELEEILRKLNPVSSPAEPNAPSSLPLAPKNVNTELPGPPHRLAFSMRETADILGVAYITVQRLLSRGLLRSSSALRRKLIPRAEIERFLRDTSHEL